MMKKLSVDIPPWLLTRYVVVKEEVKTKRVFQRTSVLTVAGATATALRRPFSRSVRSHLCLDTHPCFDAMCEVL